MDDDIYLPQEWDTFERQIFLDCFGDTPDLGNDAIVQALFHESFFEMDTHSASQIDSLRDTLGAYCEDQYDFDFDQAFDWEEWREFYESA